MDKIQFGTGGFRAVIGEAFNKSNIKLLCQAVSNIIISKNLKKDICIGYDNRFLSEDAAVWCAQVFAGNGIKAYMCDAAVSTPVVMYATKIMKNDYGIMITASHNPYMYNGIKVVVAGGRDAGIEETQEIEQEVNRIKKIKSCLNENKIIKFNCNEEYVKNITNLFSLNNVNPDIKIVFDTKHGSTAEELKLLCKQIGIKNFSIINEKRDAFFGFKDPAPNADNVEELKAEVIKQKANIGFALDADGDRLAVIDENGKYIDNNYILAICYYFLAKYCGKIGNSVKNVATSNLLDKVTEKMGFSCIEVPVGFKWVFKALNDFNAIIGGESSGGLAIHGHIGGKDSLLAIALCLKAMVVMKKSFAEIFKEVLEFGGNYSKVIYDTQYNYSPSQKEYIFNLLKDKILPTHRYEIEKVVFKDYVKVYYKNGNWSLIRFSGTEPILRIFVEADSIEDCKTMVKDWEILLKL